MRAAVFADALPAGWSLWQEHDGQYLQLSADDLKAGVSGRLVLRYDANGGKLDANVALPQVQLGFVGGAPEGAPVSVYYGYEYHSFTGAEEGAKPQYGNVKRGSAGMYALVNETSDAKANLAVKPLSAAMPRTADGRGTGYLTQLIAYAVPEKAPDATAVALGAFFPADYQGKGGLGLETLMAYKMNKDDQPEANRSKGEVDTSKKTREDNTFVGVPGKGGVMVLDVTGLSDEEIASINPLKASTVEALGLEALPYSVTEEGRIQLSRSGKDGHIDAGQSRTLYVAAPYAENTVAFEGNADKSQLVKAHFDVQVAAVAAGDNTVYAESFDIETAFQAAEYGEAFMTDEEVEAQQKAEEEPAQPTDQPQLPGLPTIGGEGNQPASTDEPEGDQPAQGDQPADEPQGADLPEPPAEANQPEEPAEPEEPAANYVEHPESAPAQLYDSVTGFDFLLTSMTGIMPFANDRVDKLPDTYLDPNLHIGNGTPVPNTTNTVMIKTSEQVYMSLQPNPTYKSGYLGKSEIYEMDERRDQAVIFRLDIPYLYFDAKGSKETLSVDEWEKAQLVPENQVKFKNDH